MVFCSSMWDLRGEKLHLNLKSVKILPEDFALCAWAGAQQAEITINSLHQSLFRGQWQERAEHWVKCMDMKYSGTTRERMRLWAVIKYMSYRLLGKEQNLLYRPQIRDIQYHFFFVISFSSEHEGTTVKCLLVVTWVSTQWMFWCLLVKPEHPEWPGEN